MITPAVKSLFFGLRAGVPALRSQRADRVPDVFLNILHSSQFAATLVKPIQVITRGQMPHALIRKILIWVLVTPLHGQVGEPVRLGSVELRLGMTKADAISLLNAYAPVRVKFPEGDVPKEEMWSIGEVGTVVFKESKLHRIVRQRERIDNATAARALGQIFYALKASQEGPPKLDEFFVVSGSILESTVRLGEDRDTRESRMRAITIDIAKGRRLLIIITEAIGSNEATVQIDEEIAATPE